MGYTKSEAEILDYFKNAKEIRDAGDLYLDDWDNNPKRLIYRRNFGWFANNRYGTAVYLYGDNGLGFSRITINK